MGDRYANPKAEALRDDKPDTATVCFLVERGRLAGAMRAMADHRGFEQMKAAVEDELRRAARLYGKREGWIG